MVVYHVNKLKVLHVYNFETTKFSVYLYSIYVGLTLNSGKLHNYLGMELEYKNQLVVNIFM